MISLLDHQNVIVSESIHTVLQLAYAKEAELIGAVDFPPLHRSATDIAATAGRFHGLWQDNILAAVVEYHTVDLNLEIDSLVVHPEFFRRGLAQKLMVHLLQQADWPVAIVDTASANVPAIRLYEKLGFIESKRWMLDIGIEKVSLTRHRSSEQTGE